MDERNHYDLAVPHDERVSRAQHNRAVMLIAGLLLVGGLLLVITVVLLLISKNFFPS